MARLEEYAPVVGGDVLEELRLLARPLQGKNVLNINSTSVGGGVSEILNRMVPLLGELGLEARWDVIKGGDDFFAATKRFHNALHGDPADVTPADFQVYMAATDHNLAQMNLDADIVFVHDPQPAALVKARREGGARWIWRCHIDLSRKNREVWEFLRPYVESYDAGVFSAAAFAQKLGIPQVLIPPSIDPLSEKNRRMDPEEIDDVLKGFDLPRDKPIVTQVSRFDRLKDPLGVIQAFRQVRRDVPCRLVLVGGSADDDPEGAQVLAEIRETARGDDDIRVLCLPPTSHREINALQRASALILQKSVREGFGLTVTEALWKAKPVIGGAVGGIPLQVIHKHSGILVHTVDGAAYWLRQMLTQPAWAAKLGQNGREHVRQNFLITRHLRDYLLLFLAVERPGDDIIRLT